MSGMFFFSNSMGTASFLKSEEYFCAIIPKGCILNRHQDFLRLEVDYEFGES